MIEQLDRLPGLSDRGRERMRPFLTALPGDSKLNVNTANPQVLAAFLPDLSAAALDQILVARRQQPFGSVQAFLVLAGLSAEDSPVQDPGALNPKGICMSDLNGSRPGFR